MAVQEQLYTAAEFWQMAKSGQFTDDKIYELVNGVIIAMSPSSKRNSWIAATFVRLLGNYAAENDLGFVLGADGGYTLSPATVRVPDASFISKVRQPDLDDNQDILAPDLAVEVISPSETPVSIHDKTALYLKAGASIVWNIYPDEKVIEVWQQGEDASLTLRQYTVEDTMDGGTVLPGFQLKVRAVFPA